MPILAIIELRVGKEILTTRKWFFSTKRISEDKRAENYSKKLVEIMRDFDIKVKTSFNKSSE
jgi:hypothetical protein